MLDQYTGGAAQAQALRQDLEALAADKAGVEAALVPCLPSSLPPCLPASLTLAALGHRLRCILY
jgi:hypothetical protein